MRVLLVVLGLLGVLGCQARRGASAHTSGDKRPMARLVPRGTQVSVQLLSPMVWPPKHGDAFSAQLLEALSDGQPGPKIPMGARIFGVVRENPLRLQFESLSYPGTTMRLRARVIPSEGPSSVLRLELEEPLPLPWLTE